MMEKTGNKETIALFVILIISQVSTGGISGFVHNSGTAAFINVLCCLLIALAACFLTSGVFNKNDFIKVFRSAYGRYAGTVLLLAFFAVTIFNASSRIAVFSEAIGKFVLNETPSQWIRAVFALCVFAVLYFGIEAITRYGFATLSLFAILIGIILLSSHTELDIINICPVLGKGGFGNVFNMLYVFADIIYMFFMMKAIKGGGRKSAQAALVTGGLTSAVLAIFYTLCVPYPVSAEFSYPLYRLASLANTTVVFQRLDGLVYIIWMFSGFVSVGALGYFALTLFSELFSLSDKKAMIPVITLIIFLLSGYAAEEMTGRLMSIFAFGILPLTGLIFKIRRRK